MDYFSPQKKLIEMISCHPQNVYDVGWHRESFPAHNIYWYTVLRCHFCEVLHNLATEALQRISTSVLWNCINILENSESLTHSHSSIIPTVMDPNSTWGNYYQLLQNQGLLNATDAFRLDLPLPLFHYFYSSTGIMC